MPNDYQEKMRQARFLEYRGFSHDQIQHVLREDDLVCG
jgi:SOS response regulatory protein OraA/RecX